MMNKEQHFCAECGDRIFRVGYKVNNGLVCLSCLREKFSVKFPDDFYVEENFSETELVGTKQAE